MNSADKLEKILSGDIPKHGERYGSYSVDNYRMNLKDFIQTLKNEIRNELKDVEKSDD